MSNELAKLESFSYQVAIVETWTEMKRLDSIGAAAAEFAKKEKLSKEKQDEIGLMIYELTKKKGAWLEENFPHGAPKGGKGNQYTGGKVTNGNLTKMPATKKESSIARAANEADKKVEDEVIRDIKKSKKVITPQAIVQGVRKKKNIAVRVEREVNEIKEKAPLIPIAWKRDCMSIIDSIQPIDLLIADPPYFTDGDYTSQISAYLKKVKPTGQAYVFMGVDPEEIKSFLSIESHHMILNQILIWNYNNTGQRQPNDRYTSNYQVYFYYRGPEAKNLNKPSDGKEQYSCQTINAPDGRIGDRYHKWQKPDELISRLIKNSSNEGDFVFDPFAGSGTTLICAGRLGRIAQGCEIDDEAIKICSDRGCKIEL